MDLSIQRVASYIRHRWQQRVRLPVEHHDSLIGLLALLTPGQARGFDKIRIGGDRDGGYVMLDDFQDIDLALSLGIGPDVSWDHDVAEKGIHVWQYDHTVARPPRDNPLFHFEPKRIVSHATQPQELALSDILQKAADKQILLKIDIEGDEWNLLGELDPGLLSNCRQLVVEFHSFLSVGTAGWLQTARQALTHLNRDFGVVHVHGNNLSKHILWGHNCVPDSLEVSFANRRFYQLEPTAETFPGRHDRKNNPYFPDFRLDRFQW